MLLFVMLTAEPYGSISTHLEKWLDIYIIILWYCQALILLGATLLD